MAVFNDSLPPTDNGSNGTQNGSVYPPSVSYLQPAIIYDNARRCTEEYRSQMGYANQYHWVLILTLTISSVNICTNAFSYWVFRQDRHSSILTRLLIRLSVTEVIFQLVYILTRVMEDFIITSRLAFTSNRAEVFSYFILYILFPLVTSIHIFRNWLVVLISSYRFEVVCRSPMGNEHSRVFRDNTICRITILTLASAIIVSLPRSIEFSMRLCPESATQVRVSGFQPRATRIKWFVYLYTSCSLFLVQTAGPCLIVCVLSVLLLQRLAVRRRFHRDLRRSSGPHAAVPANVNLLTPAAAEEHLLDPNCQQRKLSSNSGNGEEGHNGSNTFRQRLASIPRVIRKPLRRRSSAVNHRRRDRDSGHLVMALLVVFFVCEMPSFFSKVDDQLKILDDNASFTFGHIANFATQIDTFCNLFVYILSNAHFRSLLRVWYNTWMRPVVTLCCKRRENSDLDSRNRGDRETGFETNLRTVIE